MYLALTLALMYHLLINFYLDNNVPFKWLTCFLFLVTFINKLSNVIVTQCTVFYGFHLFSFIKFLRKSLYLIRHSPSQFYTESDIAFYYFKLLLANITSIEILNSDISIKKNCRHCNTLGHGLDMVVILKKPFKQIKERTQQTSKI